MDLDSETSNTMISLSFSIKQYCMYLEVLIYISSGDALNKLLYNLMVIISDGRMVKNFGAHGR